MKGKLIIIEGSDGSGKTTQLNLLKGYLEKNKKKFKTHKFPQYETSFYGKMIGNFLRGEYGELNSIDPYIISVVYAADRREAKDMMEKWLNDGNVIVMDRYSTSNAAHQCGRIPQKEQGKYLAWLEEMEYKVNQIPREDIVIYLRVPYKTSIKLLENEARENRKYAKGAILVSDSFFPFLDGPKLLEDNGIKSLFVTSGSIRDKEVFEYLKASGIEVFSLPDEKSRGFYNH